MQKLNNDFWQLFVITYKIINNKSTKKTLIVQLCIVANQLDAWEEKKMSIVKGNVVVWNKKNQKYQ